MKQSTTLWGGRFTEAIDPLFKRLNDSFAVDWQLFDEDIEGSIAWAEALAVAGVLTPDEEASIVAALHEIANDEESLMNAVSAGEYEDVHSYVEAMLGARVGALAGKLHTGRSRNDQVATDLKLWMRKAIGDAIENVAALAASLAERADIEAESAMPGYTHLKQAEPVTFGHWCLAYVEMLLRDIHRFKSAFERNDTCPLGSAALAGTPLAIHRHTLAKSLGLSRPAANSLDAVSDRDIVADYLFASSMLLVHLSRLAEDLIVFSSDEFGYVELPDSLSTGSSRMPQKKNPDLLELTRGYAARSIGDLTGFLSTVKALPLSYNKDLQLDKESAFRTWAALEMIVPSLAALVERMTLDHEKMRAAASSDLLLATEVADAIASRGVPFREAHHVVSARIAEAQKSGKTLAELGPNDDITEEDLKSLDVDRALAKRSAFGGTSPENVRAAAIAAKQIIRSLT